MQQQLHCVRTFFVCPLLTGRPWYPGLSNMARNRSTLRLQQLVQDSLVVQTVPTRLFAFMLSGTTSPVGSRITINSRATGPSFSPLFRQGLPEPLAWGHHFTVPVYTETCDYILLTSSATIKRQQLHCMRTILLIVLGHFYGYGVFYIIIKCFMGKASLPPPLQTIALRYLCHYALLST